MEQRLPSEIVSRSLRYANRPQISRELSKNMYSSSSADYYQSLCDESIKYEELEEYMNENTITFVEIVKKEYSEEFEFEREFDFQFYTAIGPIYAAPYILNIRSILHTKRKSELMVGILARGTIEYRKRFNYDHKSFYDLLTNYRILRKRIGCNVININYAKEKSLQIFNELIDKWDNDEMIIFLYAYLYMNIKIMNIPTNIPEPSVNMKGSKENIIEFVNKTYSPYMQKMIDIIIKYFNAVTLIE